MEKIKVGVLGSGDVGKVLASGFAGLGHNVKVGSREPAKLSEWVEMAGPVVSAGTFDEAARFGDLLVLACLGTAAHAVIQLAGPLNFKGKVVIDATNPLALAPGKLPALSVGWNDSLGEQVQGWLHEARVVKAFNTVGNAHMIKPQFPGGPPDMFICGNDPDAKRTVAQICTHFGWGVIDIGGIEGARQLEPMCMVWVLHGIMSGTWNHTFKMLQR